MYYVWTEVNRIHLVSYEFCCDDIYLREVLPWPKDNKEARGGGGGQDKGCKYFHKIAVPPECLTFKDRTLCHCCRVVTLSVHSRKQPKILCYFVIRDENKEAQKSAVSKEVASGTHLI